MREVPWRNRRPPVIEDRLVQLATSSSLLLVQENGPTSFVLKSTESSTKFKVTIGSNHRCSCSVKDDLCVHILFVLSKVFRLPQDNPLLWQKSFLEAEIEQIVAGRARAARERMAVAQIAARQAAAQGRPAGTVERRPVEEGDSCPICCDEIDGTVESSELVYCRFGCGNNLHRECFKAYAVHNSTNPSPLSCPLCREKWGDLDDLAGEGTKRQQAPQRTGPSIACSACRLPVLNERYRCAFCASYELCAACFWSTTTHSQHPFDVSVAGSPFVPAQRPAGTSRTRRQRSVPGVEPEGSVMSGADITGATGGGGGGPTGLADVTALPPGDPRLALMQRELGPEDYETLLQLDAEVERPNEKLTLAEVGRFPHCAYHEGLHEYDACVVCLDAFVDGCDVIQLPYCNHVFHSNCIRRWLHETKAVCPVDNTVVVPPHAPRQPPEASTSSTQHHRERQRREEPNPLDSLVVNGGTVLPSSSASAGPGTGGPPGAGPPGRERRMGEWRRNPPVAQQTERRRKRSGSTAAGNANRGRNSTEQQSRPRRAASSANATPTVRRAAGGRPTGQLVGHRFGPSTPGSALNARPVNMTESGHAPTNEDLSLLVVGAGPSFSPMMGGNASPQAIGSPAAFPSVGTGAVTGSRGVPLTTSRMAIPPRRAVR